jgi:hypothetical protein
MPLQRRLAFFGAAAAVAAWLPSAGFATTTASSGATSPGAAASPGATSVAQLPPTQPSRFGLNYFTFFDGPGLSGDPGITPNWLGRPFDDGLSLFNLVSVKWRFSDNLALDFQARIQVLLNNGTANPNFQAFRWQSPRIGISGKLASGKDWSLTGAVNTDFPYMLPSPLGGGFIAEQRTVIFNPGMFASFSWKPSGSRWSVFSLVTPRFFFYADRNAAEPQFAQSGLSPQLKPEFVFQIAPSVNYALSEKTSLRMGTILDYRKLVLSGWNPFNASLDTTSGSEAWRLWATPLQLGVNHEFGKALTIYAFVNSYPIAAQRQRRDGTRASFTDTLSFGMWLSGTIL